MGKKIAILQSNYIPWKGYFDMIAEVDEFVLYDEVQFTKNDWRNRNKIKTPKGTEWLSIPVGQNISRRICDVKLSDDRWQQKHWKTLVSNYGRAPHFAAIAAWLKPIYLDHSYTHLSQVNYLFIKAICAYLGIKTIISNSQDYSLLQDKTECLVSICSQAGATKYITGPAAKSYINENAFKKKGIQLAWFDYAGYPEYTQLWGRFVHEISILDVLFNCGKESPRYMRHILS